MRRRDRQVLAEAQDLFWPRCRRSHDEGSRNRRRLHILLSRGLICSELSMNDPGWVRFYAVSADKAPVAGAL